MLAVDTRSESYNKARWVQLMVSEPCSGLRSLTAAAVLAALAGALDAAF